MSYILLELCASTGKGPTDAIIVSRSYVWDPVDLTPVCVMHGTDWLTSSNVQKVVVVVNGMDSNEVLERWVFNVETAREAAANPQ